MKRMKITALLLALLMMAALLTGCGDEAWDDLGNESSGSGSAAASDASTPDVSVPDVSAPEPEPADDVIIGRWGARYGSLNDEGSLMDEDTVYVRVYSDGSLTFVLGDESYSGSWKRSNAELPDGYIWGGTVEVNGIDGLALIAPSDDDADYEMGFSIGEDMLFLMYR